MTVSYNDLKESIDKAYRLLKPKRSDLNIFKSNLLNLLTHIDEKESEENAKIHLADFLKNTFYHPEYLVATKGRTDLVIHLGKDSKAHAGVLFEVKKPNNKADMVSKDNLNTKAMHELILYFLRERFNNKNTSLTNLIITNIFEWYVFDATQFEKIFTQNKQLEKAFREWDNGQKVSSNTDFFYKEVAKPFLVELSKEVNFTYFDLRDYVKSLKKSGEKDDRKLISLFKFFTPVHLLKLPFINDSNSLNKGFFSELLHIIGLEEVKEGGRKIIRRLAIGKRCPGSLLENTINILELEDSLRKVPNVSSYGKTREDQLFNLSIELSLTWVNRILFLKLLEAQLMKYHNGSKEFKFLNHQTIRDYDELYKLFFQVLAKEPSSRTQLVQQKYSHIPYLNSSLFEISELEVQTIKVNGLDDNLDLDLYVNSVLKKNANRKNITMMNTLHYFFEFLDAYDFASVGKEEVQEENKSIINAAVLGLVFEKINGYRDGSFYTPGAITMFLCKETIRRAVVKKFNDTYAWQCETISDLGNYLSDRRNVKDVLEFNKLIESIKIADPAVGSGHFLVSSLNEVILIKAELGILADESGRRLSDIEVSIANDELIIVDRKSGNFFEYTISQDGGTVYISPEVQRIQQTLFNEKRKIIEGSIFGVDINPNSVKICRLRLWIELLKHAYYRTETTFLELETLPNIDINIKHGNSLLTKYSLTEDLSEVFRKQKFGVKDYQLAVEAYKDAPNKEAKTELLRFIKLIKEQFHETVGRRDPRRKKMSELRGQLILTQNNFDLFGQKRSKKDMNKEVQKLGIALDKLESEVKEIESNELFRNAFEWRFEFPEVLDEKGDFEGFEVIIGNPPYIQLQKMGPEADALQSRGYKTFVRTGDIYSLFYEQAINLLKPGYFFGYITSNKWMRANYGAATRKFFLEETNPLVLIDFGGFQVFDSATVDTNILISQKAAYSGKTQTCLIDKTLSSLEKMSVFYRRNHITNNNFSALGWSVLSDIESRIKQKIEAIGVPLGDWKIQINYGIKTGFNEAFIIDGGTRTQLLEKCPEAAEIIRPILKGRNIKKYKAEFNDLWIIFTRRGINIDVYPAVKDYLFQFYEQLKPRNGNDKNGRKPGNYKWFEIQDNIAYYNDFAREKIVWIELSDSPKFSYDDKGYFVEATAFILLGEHLKYLTAFLNSKLCDWYFDKITTTSGVGTNRWKKIYIENLPIPQIPSHIDLEFSNLLDTLTDSIHNNSKTQFLEDNLNQKILNLYNFEEDEKELILKFKH